MPYDSSVDHLLAYFSTDVLAAYQTQPDKYSVQTDYFEGTVQTTSEYYSELDAAGRTDEWISVRFGYRTKADTELVLVAWAPDLFTKSASHVARWRGFEVDRGAVSWMGYEEDKRFALWLRRHLRGDWDVENGPGAALVGRLALINGVTLEAANVRLFDVGDDDVLVVYPRGQNSHSYADAHRELYGLLVDGLDKGAIQTLASTLGVPVNCASNRTLDCLRKVFPELHDPAFASPLALVEDQRRLASHGTRQPARPMRAFEGFTDDLRDCVAALDKLLVLLERRFNMDSKKSRARQDALRRLRPIAQLLPATYSIHAATKMVGKTVARVEVGEGQRSPGAHGSEVIHVHFTDGSIMALDTGNNAWNLLTELGQEEAKAEGFHVDFIVQWVPPKSFSGRDT